MRSEMHTGSGTRLRRVEIELDGGRRGGRPCMEESPIGVTDLVTMSSASERTLLILDKHPPNMITVRIIRNSCLVSGCGTRIKVSFDSLPLALPG